MKARKKRVRYEKVWRVRWAAGDADFKEELDACFQAEVMRKHGAYCKVDSFRRAIMTKEVKP